MGTIQGLQRITINGENKMEQIIKCLTIEQFGDVIAQCVKHGLTFEADVNYLEIKLTGGF